MGGGSFNNLVELVDFSFVLFLFFTDNGLKSTLLNILQDTCQNTQAGGGSEQTRLPQL